ncbi:MAG TPA: chemotaxis protein CheW [Anaerolineae bacterium]|nr:chemotaxis protein CheW [Anaerolineae bacterium]
MRKQIVASQASLLALDDDTPEALAQLWQQRAAQLAQLPEPEVTGEQLSLIVIRLGRERYGLEVPYVRDAASARALTRVPRAPSWVSGVVTQRGHIVSVIDLQQFIGVEAAPHATTGLPSESYLVNVQTTEMEVALLVDEILGLEVIPIDQLHPIESAPHGFRTEFVRGAIQRGAVLRGAAQHPAAQAEDLLIVLDVPALLSDQRLIVNESW